MADLPSHRYSRFILSLLISFCCEFLVTSLIYLSFLYVEMIRAANLDIYHTAYQHKAVSLENFNKLACVLCAFFLCAFRYNITNDTTVFRLNAHERFYPLRC